MSYTNMNTSDEGRLGETVEDPFEIVEKEIESLVEDYLYWLTHSDGQC